MRWAPHALSLELRKAVAYRAEFWVNFVGATAGQLALAYFLWSAVFAAKGSATVGGFTFRGMMFYALLAPIVGRAVWGSEGRQVSQDIYDGSMTRYLVYPLSFYGFRYVSYLASQLVVAFQAVLMVAAFAALFGLPPDARLSVSAWARGALAVLAAGTLQFAISTSLELVSFWAENVWSLLVMFRFAFLLLGGALLPLTLFPERARAALAFTPFPYLVSLPVRACLGLASGGEYWRGIAATLAWSVVATGVTSLVWRRGVRSYTGVGI